MKFPELLSRIFISAGLLPLNAHPDGHAGADLLPVLSLTKDIRPESASAARRPTRRRRGKAAGP